MRIVCGIIRGHTWSLGIDYIRHSLHLTLVKFYIGIEWN